MHTGKDPACPGLQGQAAGVPIANFASVSRELERISHAEGDWHRRRLAKDAKDAGEGDDSCVFLTPKSAAEPSETQCSGPLDRHTSRLRTEDWGAKARQSGR
jgi:hypothetical protein